MTEYKSVVLAEILFLSFMSAAAATELSYLKRGDTIVIPVSTTTAAGGLHYAYLGDARISPLIACHDKRGFLYEQIVTQLLWRKRYHHK